MLFSNETFKEDIGKKLNFSFELVTENFIPENWTIWKVGKAQGIAEIDENTFYEGKKSIKISNAKGTFGWGYQSPFSIEEIKRIVGPEMEIKISVYVKGENVSGLPYIGLDWWRESIAGWISKSEKHLPTGTYDWQKIEFVVNQIPQNAKYFRIQLATYSCNGTIWFDKLELTVNNKKIEEILAQISEKEKAISSKSALVSENSNVRIWYEIPTQKVFPESIPPINKSEEIIIKCAKGEYEPFQLVLTPYKNFEKVNIDFTNLFYSQNSKVFINKNNFSCYEVGVITYSIKGKIPDPLIPIESFIELKEGESKSIWINVYVPEGVNSGEYKGEIILNFENKLEYKVPLKLIVWDFSLPKKTNLEIVANLWGSPILQVDKRPWDEILKDYIPDIVSHRIRGVSIGLPNAKFQNGNMYISKEDLEVLEKRIKFLKDCGIDIFITSAGPWINTGSTYIGQLKWNSDAIWRPESLEIPIKIMSEDFKKYYKQYHEILSDFFEKIKIRDNVLLYIYDEPSYEALKNLCEICKFLSDINPPLKIFMTSVPNALLNPYISVWCPPTSSIDDNLKLMTMRQKKGEKIYLYHNYLYLINQPALNSRIMPWILYKYNFDGYLFWSINAWGQNPWEIIKSDGDGYLLYPNLKGEGKPCSTIRWELWREGIEDYDYFVMLEEKINNLNQNKNLGVKERESVHKAEITLCKIYTLVKSWNNYSKDPVDYYNLREEIANYIIELNKIEKLF